MDDRTILCYGALLHDIGKVVYRGSSGKGTHAALGAQFITDEVSPLNPAFCSPEGLRVVEQIRYHHAREMSRSSSIEPDSLAYITYFADNISAGMDRKNEGDDEAKVCFDKSVDLRKIFNILGGRHDDNVIGHEDYNAIRERIKGQLAQMDIASQEVNSLLHVLEATTNTVPSSTNLSELVDVSLYDHAKTTAGLALCIYDYFREQGICDYRAALFSGEASRAYYSEPMFLLATCDMSGIQDFIYSISGSKALKQLRARSLYLELMMEHIVDELLERLSLNRVNVMYTGGGHAYVLLPNTQQAKAVLQAFENELKNWFISEHGVNLYMAFATVECSADDLSNAGEDKKRFGNLFRELSAQLSDAKAARYSAADIETLNCGGEGLVDDGRECRECHRSTALASHDDICETCESLRDISADLVKKSVFAIIDDSFASTANHRLSLPFGCSLVLYERERYLAEKPVARRVYTKNWDAGTNLSTHIWMGDYTADMGTEGIASYAKAGSTLEDGKGIQRLGVLRADVDNLGTAFASGIPASKASISRTATLSRALSLFFKKQVNKIFVSRQYRLQIIYSGGDDLFIVGNWSDVLYAALDLRQSFKEFTGNGCLTISAGVGMFDEKYPIARMASETGSLEDAAKMYAELGPDGNERTKNAVALWSADSVFSWDDLANVVEPRMREIAGIFKENDKGKAFIYKIVSLLRHYDDVISAPRLAYLLARSFEGCEKRDELCQQFYAWASDSRERRCLVAALEWYVYSIRERG